MNAPSRISGANRTLTDELLERRSNAFSRGMSAGQPVFASKAKNAELWDVEGRRYIDFGGRHRRAEHRAPAPEGQGGGLAEQLERFTHTCFMVSPTSRRCDSPSKLNASAPISGHEEDRALHHRGRGGGERREDRPGGTGRTGVVVFSGAFHGRTIMAWR